MRLSSFQQSLDKNQTFNLNRVQIVTHEGYVAVIQGKQLYIGTQLKNQGNNKNRIVLSGDVRLYHLTEEHKSKASNNTQLDAYYLPTYQIKTKNEDEAEAKFFTFDQLEAEGEKDAKIYYKGFPVIKKDMKGKAKLIEAN